jgi:hypothetical protein
MQASMLCRNVLMADPCEWLLDSSEVEHRGGICYSAEGVKPPGLWRVALEGPKTLCHKGFAGGAPGLIFEERQWRRVRG